MNLGSCSLSYSALNASAALISGLAARRGSYRLRLGWVQRRFSLLRYSCISSIVYVFLLLCLARPKWLIWLLVGEDWWRDDPRLARPSRVVNPHPPQLAPSPSSFFGKRTEKGAFPFPIHGHRLSSASVSCEVLLVTC